MKFEFAPLADAAYFEIAEGEIAHTEEIKPRVMLDWDAEGNVLGIEVLSVSQRAASIPPIRKVA